MFDINRFDEAFRRHLFIEMYFGEWATDRLITEDILREGENVGVFNGCLSLANSIMKRCKFECTQGREGFEMALRGNPFIDNLSIHFIPGGASEYDLNRSFLNDNGRFNPLYINISINDIKGWPKKVGTIMHELTHAYEDANRKENNAPSLYQVGVDTGYFSNNRQMGNLSNLYTDPFTTTSYMLYLFDDSEVNGFIATIRGALENSNAFFKNGNDVYRYITNLPIYKTYMSIMSYARYLYSLTSKEQQDGCINIVTRLTGEYFGRNFNNFKKWLYYKVNKITKKFNSTLPKMAAEFFKNQNNTGRSQMNSIGGWLQTQLNKRR